MAFQRVPNTALFQITGFLTTGQAILNDLYVVSPLVEWDGATLDEVGQAIGNIWRDDVCPELASIYTFDKVHCVSLDEEFGAQFDVEYNATGGVALLPLTPALCIFVKFTTAGGGAPRRGGNFVSPFDEAAIAIDLWSAGKTGPIQTAYQDIGAAISATGDSRAHVVVSRHSKSVNPTPPHLREEGVVAPVVSYAAREVVATQRDRRVGHGS